MLPVQQLQHFATLGSDAVSLATVQGVFQSDSILTTEVKQRLLTALQPLEDVPDAQKDWHPGSNQQVLDMVHPSVYPLVYGVSRALPEAMTPGIDSWKAHIGAGSPVPPPAVPQGMFGPDTFHVSQRFAWLPSEVDVSDDGRATFTSYINNLHPDDHQPLYSALEELLTSCVPLLEATLTHRSVMPATAIEYDISTLRRPTPGDRYDVPDSDAEELQNAQEDPDYTMWHVPQVPAHYLPPPPPAAVSLAGRRLQVIVKIAEIHLSPEQAEYPGGSWHVEGMQNERIVASVIAYLEADNITDSQLAFRYPIDSLYSYEQNDWEGVELVYGLQDGGELSQHAGAVHCKAGRVICFPNTMQHRVQPFRLADASRPGVRKIVVFFLVDPGQRVMSTAGVPPQQLSWWRRQSHLDGQLPSELLDRIQHALDCPMTHDAALRYREELMAERSEGVKEVNDFVYEQTFSLCEH